MRDWLIALCGLTPQVITETLWALAHQRPAVVPQEVKIVTTVSGKAACERLLFGKKGKLASYLREYAPSRKFRCGPRTVITLKGSDERPLDDLRTQQDNLAVADHLAAIIRDLTALPNTRLHCSVAGGRKTMGVLLATILQVYGRPDDRLYHVLVSPEFESHPDFFYIPKRPCVLAGKRLDTREARIELAEIPYVRLRAYLPDNLLEQTLPFTELVSLAEKHLRALERLQPIKVNTAARRLVIGDTVVKLSPAQALLYSAFARVKREQCVDAARESCGACSACYRAVSKANWDSARGQLEELAGERFLSAGIAYFRSLISKSNKAIVKEFGTERLAVQYEIRSEHGSGETRYGLAVDKTLINIES